MQSDALLEMRNINKSFGDVHANRHISLDVRAGEVLGLLGENGAGKSTLMNILYGMIKPDSGEIFVNNAPVNINSSRDAINLGIGMVHQHFMLLENFTALENVLLGIDSGKSQTLDLDGAKKKFKKLAKEYSLLIDPDIPVWQLSVGEQQWLEILKLLYRDVKILVLDEPTAVLAPSQVTQLFYTIRRLVDEGRSVVFISHKLEEVEQITNRVTVLRDGTVVGTRDTKQVSPSDLATMMVGRPVSLARKDRPIRQGGKEVLKIDGLWCNDDRGIPILRGLNLSVREGEILGIAGVDGNGQRELAECIAGLRKPTNGYVAIEGDVVRYKKSDQAKLGFIPEDRRKTGLVTTFSIAENLVLKSYYAKPFSNKIFLDWKAIKEHAKNLVKKYKIKVSHVDMTVATLSGGNQQKVVVAREVNSKPKVLLCSQATRGLDLGAVEFLHDLVLNERNSGSGVVFISTELSEVLALSDRLIVLFSGESMGELNGESADIQVVGEMMLGKKKENSSNEILHNEIEEIHK